jgi:hypothetical protein
MTKSIIRKIIPSIVLAPPKKANPVEHEYDKQPEGLEMRRGAVNFRVASISPELTTPGLRVTATIAFLFVVHADRRSAVIIFAELRLRKENRAMLDSIG